MAIEKTEIPVGRRLVLDANILLNGILGTRLLSLLERYEDTVSFYSPDVCFDDTRRYISTWQYGAGSILLPAFGCSIK